MSCESATMAAEAKAKATGKSKEQQPQGMRRNGTVHAHVPVTREAVALTLGMQGSNGIRPEKLSGRAPV
jgi:hypothetical protein